VKSDKFISYKGKKFYSLLILNLVLILFIIVISYQTYPWNSGIWIAFSISIYFLLQSLWILFKRINIKIFNNKGFYVYNSVFGLNLKKHFFDFKNIDEIIILKDVESKYIIKLPGMYYQSKFECCIKIVLDKNSNENYLFDAYDLTNGKEILKSLNEYLKP